jgi:hypothetical protein
MHRTFKLIDFFLAMGKSVRRLKKYLIGPGETERQPCSFQSRIISETEYCHFLLLLDQAN